VDLASCGPAIATAGDILARVPIDGFNPDALFSELSAASAESDVAVGLSDADSDLASAEQELTTESKAIGCFTNSFQGTTKVVMADGSTKPISQIKVGDKVSNNAPGADPGTGNQIHVVTAVHVTYTDTDFTDVTVNTPRGSATITGTAHHPYWDETTGVWTDADQLRPGDDVETSNAELALVLALHGFTSHTIVIYNLTVDGLHTYYVVAGDTPILVHNNAPCTPPEVGPGASLDNLSIPEQLRIQNAANRINRPVSVVGGRWSVRPARIPIGTTSSPGSTVACGIWCRALFRWAMSRSGAAFVKTSSMARSGPMVPTSPSIHRAVTRHGGADCQVVRNLRQLCSRAGRGTQIPGASHPRRLAQHRPCGGPGAPGFP
jgi:hypothetical protein